MAPFATILTILYLYLITCIGADYPGEVVLAVRLEAEKIMMSLIALLTYRYQLYQPYFISSW